MSSSVVYVKTPKGIDEMNNRSHGLPPRLRQLLILLDGKRNSAEIAQMFPEGESLLAELVSGGFIVQLQQESETSAADPVTAPENDAERFEMAKNFMRNTVHAFLGGLGSGLIAQIDKCGSLDQLRPLYESWREAVLLSNDGRKQLVELEKRLAALLS